MTDNLHRVVGTASVPRADDAGIVRPAAPVRGGDAVQTLGERLGAARARKGWTIEDVSARLKVTPAKLRALESGDLSLLPETTFAVGIVRSYAKMLDIEPTPLIDELRRLRGDTAPSLASASLDGPTGGRRAHVPLSWGTRRSDPRSWLWAVAAGVVIVVALAIWHTGNESNGWLARLKANVPDAASNHAASVSIATDLAGIGPTASATDITGVDSAASGAPVEASGISASASGAAAVTAASEDNTAAAAAVSSALVSGQAATPAQTSASGAAVAVVAASAAGVSTLQLSVSQDTWVSVRQQGGKEVFSGILHAGSDQAVQGQRPFQLVIGNAAGVSSITLDGKSVAFDASGARNNVARLNLP